MTKSSTRLGGLKAMFWKEWRENLKWALLMGAAWSLLLSYIVWRAVDHDNNNGNELLNLWQSTQPLTLFVVPLLAGVLGFLQVNSELRRDQWAFLVHRPATRDTLFRGKVLAGLSLYVLAAFLPYLGFCWWMSVPGHVPSPFDWRLAAAGMAPLLSGVVFYFAGILTAIGAKPWLGSRALALPGSVLCVLWISLGDWWPLLWLLVFVAFFVVAARGSFGTTGRFRGQSRLSQIALSSTLLAGLAVVTTLGLALVSAALFSSSRDVKPQIMRSYQVTEKGRVLRSSSTMFDGGSYSSDASISDLNGHVLARGSNRDFYKRNPILQFTNLMQSSSLPSPLSNAFGYYFSSYPYVDFSQGDVTLWYFDRVHNRLAGYSRRTRYPVGYIGLNGFQTNAAQVKPFNETLSPPSGYEQTRILRSPHSVYTFDATTRTARQVFTSSQLVIGASSLGGYGSNIEPEKSCTAVWTNDNVLHLLSPQGQRLWTRHIAINHEDLTQLLVAQTSKADRFWIWIQPYNKKHLAQPQTLIEVNARGETLNQQTLPLLPLNRSTSNGEQNILLVAMPPVVTAASVGFRLYSGQNFAQSLGAISGDSPAVLGITVAFVLLSLVASTLCAVLAWRRANRYAFKSSTRLWWTTGVFALGPLGYLLMRSLLDWPALEKCPSCGKLRVVNHERCEHCNSPFAAPLPDGTEIIENDAPEMPALRLAS